MMDRRKFLGSGAAALTAMAMPKWLGAQTCQPTAADKYAYGPYYLENAPKHTQIGPAGQPGAKLSISGTVSNCAGPMPGVRLEVWQATTTGCYIHPLQPGCPDGGNPAQSRLWGELVSDAQGKYAFESIKPGKYLNGAKYRPSHIHFRIRTPAGASTPTDLVTQLYFQGDPDIKGDFGADDPGAASRIIPLTQGTDSPLRGIFNVTLPGNASGIEIGDPALRSFDVLVQRRGGRYLLHLPPRREGVPVLVRLYDSRGRLVRTSTHRASTVELDIASMPMGLCVAELTWETHVGTRRESVTLER